MRISTSDKLKLDRNHRYPNGREEDKQPEYTKHHIEYLDDKTTLESPTLGMFNGLGIKLGSMVLFKV
jgi:hypothetical protein